MNFIEKWLNKRKLKKLYHSRGFTDILSFINKTNWFTYFSYQIQPNFFWIFMVNANYKNFVKICQNKK